MILSLGLIGHRGQYSDAQQEYERAQPRSSKPYRNQGHFSLALATSWQGQSPC